MSKHFSVNIAVVDTSHFIDFNIPPLQKKTLLFGILVFIHQIGQWDEGNNEVEVFIFLWHEVYSSRLYRLAAIF